MTEIEQLISEFRREYKEDLKELTALLHNRTPILEELRFEMRELNIREKERNGSLQRLSTRMTDHEQQHLLKDAEAKGKATALLTKRQLGLLVTVLTVGIGLATAGIDLAQKLL